MAHFVPCEEILVLLSNAFCRLKKLLNIYETENYFNFSCVWYDVFFYCVIKSCMYVFVFIFATTTACVHMCSIIVCVILKNSFDIVC